MANIIAEIVGQIVTWLGFDGTDFRNVKVDAAGELQVDVLTSALAAGAATEATLATLATEAKLELCRLLLVSLAGEDFATQATLAALLTELQLKADLTETQPVSAAALPLPTGAATEATLATRASEAKLELVRLLLVSLAGEDFATQGTLDALLTELQMKADLTETQPVSAAALPLPTGAATAANQATEITALQLIDDLRAALHSVNGDELQVNVETSALPTGAAAAAHQVTMITALQLIDDLQTALGLDVSGYLRVGGVSVTNAPQMLHLGNDGEALVFAGWNGTSYTSLATDGSNRAKVAVDTSVLPTGAATAANQELILARQIKNTSRFADVVALAESTNTADAGKNDLNFDPPGAGKWWYIVSAQGVDVTSAITAIRVLVIHGGVGYRFGSTQPVAIGEFGGWNGGVLLGPTDYMRVSFIGCIALDYLRANIVGWEVDIT